ncbi:STAM-binding protein [Platysternon megacephalum]|uniref:STAM-binding protein n=1 Tax=Platysternon megacephalum TaxID=55544 RepID=A0A4D9DV39_9SAUR|nr:STAM-binding protein [Platysternon megacephalum]
MAGGISSSLAKHQPKPNTCCVSLPVAAGGGGWSLCLMWQQLDIPMLCLAPWELQVLCRAFSTGGARWGHSFRPTQQVGAYGGGWGLNTAAQVLSPRRRLGGQCPTAPQHVVPSRPGSAQPPFSLVGCSSAGHLLKAICRSQISASCEPCLLGLVTLQVLPLGSPPQGATGQPHPAVLGVGV